jgi:preprotein translocase subunit SecA
VSPEGRIIMEVEKEAQEWLEHVENPDRLVSGILARKIVQQKNYIEYLERRLEHAERNTP